jgi:hypothetical protein
MIPAADPEVKHQIWMRGASGRRWKEHQPMFAPHGAAQDAPQPLACPVTGYVPIPLPLLRAYAHDPLAVGCYVAVARYALAARGPVPLSAQDLARFDGDARAAACTQIRRRLHTLAQGGWLVLIGKGAGVKPVLGPAWGSGRDGAPRPWRWGAPALGRPGTIAVVRVPTALLDAAIGRLDPRPGQRAAVVSRYVSRPALGIADLGIYALRRAGITIAPSPALDALGLADAGAPVPTPRGLLAAIAAGAAAPPTGDTAGPIARAGQEEALPDRCSPLSPPESHTRSRPESRSGSSRIPSYCARQAISAWVRDRMDLDGMNQSIPPCPPQATPAADGCTPEHLTEQAWAPDGDREPQAHVAHRACAPDPERQAQAHTTEQPWAPDGHMPPQAHEAEEACAPDPDRQAQAQTSEQPWAPDGDGEAQAHTAPAALTPGAVGERGGRAAPVNGKVAGHTAGELSPEVRTAHLTLNPSRAIAPGEWLELAAIERAVGHARLLVWQARTTRAGAAARPQGVTPAYYAACRAREATAEEVPALSAPQTGNLAPATRPAPPAEEAPEETRALRAPEPREIAPPPSPARPLRTAPTDAAACPPAASCEARLAALGIRSARVRRALATVDVDLLARWERAFAHPGFQKLARDPGAFAAAGLREGAEPPSSATLDRYAPREMARGGLDLAAYLAAPAPAVVERATPEAFRAALATSSYRPQSLFLGWNAPGPDIASAERSAL